MNRGRQSTLHLQMGQEVIYLLLTIAVATSLMLVAWIASQSQAPPIEVAVDQGKSSLPMPPETSITAPPGMKAPPTTKSNEPLPDAQPPLISLKESDGFSFASGSAEITPSFAQLLEGAIVSRIRELSETYNAEIIEVVGHTDGVPLSAGTRAGGNLDSMLHRGLNALPGELLAPSDNVGLGMGRAIAVALALRAAGLEERYILVPLSAGPLVGPGDNVFAIPQPLPDAKRRRIEIRLRRRFADAQAIVSGPR